MRALVAKGYGPVTELKIEEVPVPTPGPGQVLVRVEAAALNPLDVKLLSGAVSAFLPVAFPFVPGMDVSGRIAALGEGVSGYAEGDRVVAFLPPTGCGGLAEYALAEAGPCVAVLPDGLGAVEAATLPVAGLTARALAEAAGKGRVFVIGASGGVGSFLVQLLARAGAEVIGTARPQEAARLERLGAAATVPYADGEAPAGLLERWPEGADTVVDLVGQGEGVLAGASAVRDGGLLLSLAFGPEEVGRGVEVRYLGLEPVGLAELVAAGLVHDVGAVRPFADAPAAVAEYESGHHSGKHVLEFRPQGG